MSPLSLLQMLFFSSVSSVMRRGLERPLEAGDMPLLPDVVHPARVAAEPERFEVDSGPWAFVRSVLQREKRFVLLAFLLMLLRTALQLATPLLVYRLVTIVSGLAEGSIALWSGLVLAAAVAFVPTLGGLAIQHYFYQVLRVTMRINGRLNLAIFRHALGISHTERAKRQIGDLVNHIGVDSDAIAYLPMMICEISASAILLVGGCAVLASLVGWSSLSALVAIAVLVPLSRRVAPRLTSIYRELIEASDERVTLISQILRGIRVVKYFCWGKGMEKEVNAIRARELALRRRQAFLMAITNLMFTLMPTLIIVSVLLTHVMRGFALDAATVFACLSVVGLLSEPLGHITYQINQMLTNKVSAERIASFLRMGRSSGTGIERDESLPASTIRFENVSVKFDGTERETLSGVNLEVRAGESVALVGPVASGKTTLLMGLLGEVPLVSGRAVVGGESAAVAWVPQEPFIMNATLRENIVMGAEASNALAAVVGDCALGPDLAALPAGLETEIGDHGVNLSGGQKQRVALARAALSGSSVVLLDDPLSAVDPATEDDLVERLLFGRWQGVTRLVATHRLAHLQRFDRVVFLLEGRILAQGTYAELVAWSPEFRDFVAETERIERAREEKEKEEKTELTFAPADDAAHRITEDEDREVGAVRGSVYVEYLKALGGRGPRRRLNLAFLAACIILPSFMFLVQDSWFAVWLNRAQGFSLPIFESIRIPPDSLWGLAVYAGLASVTVALVLWAHFFGAWRSIDSGRILHEDALSSVLRAPMRFFDSTPPGRILNRFSRDIGVVENNLVEAFFGFTFSITRMLMALLFAFALLPVALVMVPPIAFLYYWAQKVYRASAREAKRLDSIARSPRYNHFKETLEGLTVVRAFSRQTYFLTGFFDRLSESIRMFHANILMNRWFSSRVPLLSCAVNLSLTVAIVIAARNGNIQAGTAGLVLSISLSLTDALNWTIRAFSDLESNMTSVERLRFFAGVECEPDTTATASIAPEAVWPRGGSIEFRRVKARYAEHLPLVLNDVSFRIPSGTRAGVVGRTGSGKSTLFQALFRFIEIESGAILIDSADIAGIPLDRLRGSMAIIPQDPTLFVGTLRRNLDYFGRHSDAEIEAVLRRVRLWEAIERLPGGLAAPVQENGSNFSQGQRQLLCLARAFLENARIIVLDEATASVDVQTDALVQRTLREECRGITVVTIAHRLGTLSDYDLVIELDEGEVRRVEDRRAEALRVAEPVCAAATFHSTQPS